ncbi:hypothetical protein OSB04_017744 [Centaurea solstitialis]|uniref:Tetraspanin-6 n=1 Tax=Centaurea solstitialis TaxID=347529 RepID=A0AA38WL12_9ASTR|nr:hypothetical protein OSB04_017744 [Centaurea solstitialis]
MSRFSNTVIGVLNLFTLLASIPIIGGALWMARSSATCDSFLQTPLLVIGFVILIVSLVGFIGACFHLAWALWVYLLVMLLLIAALMVITIFGFIVTGAGGGGSQVSGRVYNEYHLEDYSPWLRKRVEDPKYWSTVRSCILGSKTCREIVMWSPVDYLTKDMSPIQSGCCKPPSICSYEMATMDQDLDCYKWNNDPSVLCYECDSCKAGVLEDVRRDWRKLSVLNFIMTLLLIGIYCIGCCAFRNTRRAETDYPYGENRMSKVRPRWDFFWWRWWHERRHSLY